jgi:hypothetical protein
MLTLPTSFKPLFLWAGEGVNPLVELTVNNKEENSLLSQLCPRIWPQYNNGSALRQSEKENKKMS